MSGSQMEKRMREVRKIALAAFAAVAALAACGPQPNITINAPDVAVTSGNVDNTQDNSHDNPHHNDSSVATGAAQ